MAEYNPRNRNIRNDAPLSWSQRFYDSRPERERESVCGFVERDDA